VVNLASCGGNIKYIDVTFIVVILMLLVERLSCSNLR